ncbi:MAG: 2'-5' RNA ligase family protein [Candidatus Zixiibacteriota bacterium]
MKYALIATFDDTSNAWLTDIWQKLSNCGIKAELLGSDVKPHITIAACENINRESLLPALESLALQTKSFDIVLSHIGLFTSIMNVVYYGPTVTEEFLAFHKLCHDTMEPHIEGIVDLYMPDIIVPHVTLCLGIDSSRICSALEKANQGHLPQTCRIERVTLIDVDTLGRIQSWPLA